jgi:hypothetical protein
MKKEELSAGFFMMERKRREMMWLSFDQLTYSLICLQWLITRGRK